MLHVQRVVVVRICNMLELCGLIGVAVFLLVLQCGCSVCVLMFLGDICISVLQFALIIMVHCKLSAMPLTSYGFACKI